jgi:hypothetical protein
MTDGFMHLLRRQPCLPFPPTVCSIERACDAGGVQTEGKLVECPTNQPGADAAPNSRDGGERDHRADSG